MNCAASPMSFSQNSNSLSTPEPHYIPGYAGYLPQEKYRPGHTYGITSHRVLLDPCIHMSPRTLLNNIHPENCTDAFGRPGIGTDSFGSSQMALVNTRVNSFGRQQYQPNMTPGYTGFVPRIQTILGHTYSPACNRALARFEQDRWRDRLFTKELEALDGWRFCYKTKPWESPETIRPANTDLQEFSRNSCGGNRAQQTIPNFSASPARGGCSSCAGGGSCGSNSGSSCGNSGDFSILRGEQPNCEYGDRRIWGLATENLSTSTYGNINPRKNSHVISKPLSRVQEIYRHCEGMNPNYQGHVPGFQFRIGKTYGSATRNPKRAIEPAFHSPLCYPPRL